MAAEVVDARHPEGAHRVHLLLRILAVMVFHSTITGQVWYLLDERFWDVVPIVVVAGVMRAATSPSRSLRITFR
jgi:hypothetical protein